ncbi:hypothetical protein B0T13DRAFT_451550 [Neurospora crassa]|nr:hypothetical protein B0T13DRAFT_451550 [Neurospora crassa]
MARIQNQQHRRAPRASRWRVASDEDRFKLQCNAPKIPRPQRTTGQNNANDAGGGVLTTALQYYLFAPDAAPIIGMAQVLSGCRHHPSASPSSTGTSNSSMSSTGFVLEARTFLSGMELASPSPTTYGSSLRPRKEINQDRWDHWDWFPFGGVGAGCGVRHGLIMCGEGGKTRGCMGSPDGASRPMRSFSSPHALPESDRHTRALIRRLGSWHASAEVALVRSGQQDAIIACHPLETDQLFDAETAGPRERSYATGATVA